MTKRKMRLSEGPASRHAGEGEVIREFTDGFMHGGLISIRTTDDETRPVRLEVYRTEGQVSVLAHPADIAAAIGESDAAELRRLLDEKFPRVTDIEPDAEEVVRPVTTGAEGQIVDGHHRAAVLGMVERRQEVIVHLADGSTLRSGSEIRQAGGYVRLCSPDGEEIAYWDSAEWKEDPILVMGAIMTSAAGVRLLPFDGGAIHD